MKKQNTFAAYILIGVGIYFLLRKLQIPIITDFYSWPTLLIIIGIALLIYSYTARDYQHLFSGTVVLGIGIHFHGLEHYGFWIDHWAVYLLIVGIAFIVRAIRTKKGFMMGLLLIGLAILFIFSFKLPGLFDWVYDATDFFENFWPLLLIVIGIIWLKKKK
ncbi:LiaI-LiaF-like domain-containing protein [Virgibacillus siamensis]|uniref:LiaI-LiaF-like domain-containing protein n=1 Tax=Virgibacillus siamensis TaxID=480071 RepID=UPI0009866214|nr:DUF5668 domain-containing protein [Virgibacillus siamensis]